MILAYVQEDCENVTYDLGKMEDWFKRDKKELGLEFSYLPYYIDGNLKLSQSMAIIRHLGRKYNLYGQDYYESSVIDMLVDQSWDIKQNLIKIAYDPDFVRFII